MNVTRLSAAFYLYPHVFTLLRIIHVLSETALSHNKMCNFSLEHDFVHGF